MRVLISCCPLYGHLNTVLPLALAAQAAGHEVVIATGPDLVPRVEKRGVSGWPVGPTHVEAGGERRTDWVAYFIATAKPRAADLVTRGRRWAPDLVIQEETELAGAVVAADTGARHVVHGLGLMPSIGIWQAFGPALDRLGESWDVPGLADAVRDATYLHVCPPALRPLQEPIWSAVQPLRPTTGTAGPDERLPDAIGSLPHERTVHVTLGTVFHGAADVLATTIEGLRDLPVNLVVTSGPGTDPGRFGPQPPHVLIEPYLPHALLLPRCDLVVAHGGEGSCSARWPTACRSSRCPRAPSSS
jgi:UDP:flavonoid glycosyltransferase YjiC (YdhE family)